MESKILVIYYSKTNHTSQLAQQVIRGIDSIPGCQGVLRTVAPVSNGLISIPSVPNTGAPYVTDEDISQAKGLIIGSPTRFGNMSAALKYWIDSLGDHWLRGTLEGKPGACFTSSATAHGGQESTLLTMALPLIHLGMIYVGVPYSIPELTSTKSGGTPYGASHIATTDNTPLSEDEKIIARALGARVAKLAAQLSGSYTS